MLKDIKFLKSKIEAKFSFEYSINNFIFFSLFNILKILVVRIILVI